MQHWELQVIVYERDGRFEAEAINAAIAGVGNTPFEALHSFQQMAFSMAVAAVEAGARLTYKADAEDDALFRGLQNGKIGDKERTQRDIVAISDIHIGIMK